jgi:methyltransferase (TIGR00027 family)
MQQGQPSRTAMGAAAHRAAHQVLEQGRVFHDPLALRILGSHADALVQEARDRPDRRPMRLFIAARTRFAEDALGAAVARGTRRLVVLGAGLDTFAYRNPHEGLAVIEVDHPATQAWKRERLAGAGLTPPPSLTFAPIDFERETLADGLAAAGFDPTEPAFFLWLGVVPYLTEEAIVATLGFLGELPGGAEVVFDYSDPPLDDRARRRVHVQGVPPAQRGASSGARGLLRQPARRRRTGEVSLPCLRQRRLVGKLVLRGVQRRMKASPLVFRVFTVAGEPGRQVVLTIGKPRPGHGAWTCRIRIEGIPRGRGFTVGEDPLQALQLALARARRMLDASGLPLLWLPDGEPGDVGIPLAVPTGHGFQFQRKLERYVERESKRFEEAVAAFLKEKERRRAARSAPMG